MKIGIIHATLDAVQPISGALQAQCPGVQIRNFVNEELLAHANRCGGVDCWGVRSFFRTAMLAAEAEVDGILIACTLYSSYAAQLQQYTPVPVVAVDQPMICQAAASGQKIGILATTAASAPAAEQKLAAEALRRGVPLETAFAAVPEAMAALKQGDTLRHDRLIRQAALSLRQQDCRVLLLTQITMARAAPLLQDLDAAVLTSPDTGAAELIRQIGGEGI